MSIGNLNKRRNRILNLNVSPSYRGRVLYRIYNLNNHFIGTVSSYTFYCNYFSILNTPFQFKKDDYEDLLKKFGVK